MIKILPYLIYIIGGTFLIVNVTMAFESMFLHIRYNGKLKRGIGVWSEVLPVDIKLFMDELSNDIVDQETGAFIRQVGDIILIRAIWTKPFWRLLGLWGNALPYVAYVDLGIRKPRIQYRVPMTTFLFLLCMGLLVSLEFREIATFFVLVLFSALSMNHYIQRKRIMKFIYEKMRG